MRQHQRKDKKQRIPRKIKKKQEKWLDKLATNPVNVDETVLEAQDIPGISDVSGTTAESTITNESEDEPVKKSFLSKLEDKMKGLFHKDEAAIEKKK